MKKVIPFIILTMMLTGCGATNNDDGEGNNENNNSGTGTTTAATDSMPDESGTPSSDSADQNESGDDGIAQQTGDIAAMKPLAASDMIGWGLGSSRDKENRPTDAVSAQEKYGEYDAVFIGDNEKKIYLTFDEGYENGYTAGILDTLKKKNVKAIFFVTYDYCKNSPDLVKRMIDEGHIVGNHSYSHPSLPQCSEGEVKEEIMMLHDYVKEKFNYDMKLMRFPKGEFNVPTLEIMKNLGYKSVFWSFAYSDWDTGMQPEPHEAYKKITTATHNGGIFLLHAVSETNASILGDVIDYWEKHGFELSAEL